MAEKFLEEMDIEEIQEMMAMTRIGQAIFKKGEEQGKLEGMAEKLVEQIGKKLTKGKTIAEIADALEEKEEVIEEMIGRYNLTAK